MIIYISLLLSFIILPLIGWPRVFRVPPGRSCPSLGGRHPWRNARCTEFSSPSWVISPSGGYFRRNSIPRGDNVVFQARAASTGGERQLVPATSEGGRRRIDRFSVGRPVTNSCRRFPFPSTPVTAALEFDITRSPTTVFRALYSHDISIHVDGSYVVAVFLI